MYKDAHNSSYAPYFRGNRPPSRLEREPPPNVDTPTVDGRHHTIHSPSLDPYRSLPYSKNDYRQYSMHPSDSSQNINNYALPSPSFIQQNPSDNSSFQQLSITFKNEPKSHNRNNSHAIHSYFNDPSIPSSTFLSCPPHPVPQLPYGADGGYDPHLSHLHSPMVSALYMQPPSFQGSAQTPPDASHRGTPPRQAGTMAFKNSHHQRFADHTRHHSSLAPHPGEDPRDPGSTFSYGANDLQPTGSSYVSSANVDAHASPPLSSIPMSNIQRSLRSDPILTDPSLSEFFEPRPIGLSSCIPSSSRDRHFTRSPSYTTAASDSESNPSTAGISSPSLENSNARTSAMSSAPQPSSNAFDSFLSPGKKKKKSKMHECEICGKQFPRPSGLKTHMNTHSNEKPYACNFPGCRRTFGVRSNAKRHLRTHGVIPKPSSTPIVEVPYVVGFSTPVVLENRDENGEEDKAQSKTKGVPFFKLRWMPPSSISRTNVARLRSLSDHESLSDEDGDDDIDSVISLPTTRRRAISLSIPLTSTVPIICRAPAPCTCASCLLACSSISPQPAVADMEIDKARVVDKNPNAYISSSSNPYHPSQAVF